MSTIDFPNQLISIVAQVADLSLKPWKHSVLLHDDTEIKNINLDNFRELILRIECRDLNGERHFENDLELEIFRSGGDFNITLSWLSFPHKPILWQGKHSLWMDAHTGKRCSLPADGEKLEAFSRRLRARFLSLFN